MEGTIQWNQLFFLTEHNLSYHAQFLLQRNSRWAPAMKRISAAFCVQSVYTTVSPSIHAVDTHAPAAYPGCCCQPTAISCTIGAYAPAANPGCLSSSACMELAGCQRNQVEILLMARMGSMAIALKYNIKNIQNDIHKIQAHNWGSLMLAPIMGQLIPATSSYNSDMVTRPSLSCRDSVITVQS